MGGKVSKTTEASTLAAYTYRGFGCGRCCNKNEFLEGAPTATSCGTTCGAVHFEFPAEHSKILLEFQADLPAAAQVAQEHITWLSYILFSQFNGTVKVAAEALNGGWCSHWNNQRLHAAGLRCEAASEVYGFGRSRATYLVIRVYSLTM